MRTEVTAAMQQQRHISTFPFELVEKILSNLRGEALVAASQVCWLWSCVAHRIMEKRNGEAFSEELLQDIRLEIEERKGDHLLDLYRETHPHLTLLNETAPVELHHAIAAVEVDGGRVYLGDGVGNILVYELLDGADACLTPEPVVSVVLDGPVIHMGLMKAKNILFACSPNILYALSTNCDDGGVVSLRPIQVAYPPQEKSLTMKVHGDLLGVSPSPSQIDIFRVEGELDGQLQMSPVAVVTPPHSVFRWKIWDNKVLCVLKTGSVSVWDIAENRFTLNSEPYSELRYQNPCWLFQRYVMCSSEVSRNMLSYWHISCGPAYWLFGRLDDGLPEPQKFRSVLPPDASTLCIRRRLLACSTRSPFQLMVYALPADAPHDRESLTAALQTPLVTLPVAEHIQHLDIAFDAGRVHIFACTQPGHLYCYTLAR